MGHPFAIAAAIASVLVPQPVRAASPDDQAFLGIFAETSAMRMAGMSMPKLPPGIKLPPQAANALKMISGSQRKVTVRLWSPGIAANDATASLAIPNGLKLGPKLDLTLYRPKGEAGEGDSTPTPGAPKLDEMVIKRYWGSSATVKSGQPDVTEFKGLSPEQKAAMKAQAAKAQRGAAGSYYYKPDWTTGYWPVDRQPGTIEDEATLAGHYALTTSYTGNVEMDVPGNVNFLAPIEMSSPDLEKPIKFSDAITFKWTPLPNALGYHAQIIGMQGDKTIIMWSSSEAKPDMGLQMDYLQMAEVRDLVSKDLVMKGDTAEVTVPAGIFNDCDIVMFQMIGWGPGAAIDKGQPLPRLQTKSTLNIMLGGKKMPRPPGFGG
jgi:hypothetical protein